jgi:translocation and assembly module TamB
VEVRARFERFFAIRRSDVETELSGDVAVHGPIAGPNVDGRLEVDRALVRPAELPGSGPAVAHDATIQVVGAPVAPGPEKAASTAALASGAMTMNVTVAIARNAWIRRSDADIEIGGNVTIKKAANEPVRIVGEIRLIRGWYVFQGRRFTLEEGTISFTGATPPDPNFDITASYKRSDYRIEIHITGSAKKPTLTMSSDPPLEQADILSVILFGKPSSQLGKGQSAALQQQALGLAAGYAIPELRASVMDALGLDTLDVEMPEGEGPGRVSAGRYVAEDVFVSLGQEFGRRAAQVMGVEYSITTNISVRGSTTTRGDSAVDLFWRHRY